MRLILIKFFSHHLDKIFETFFFSQRIEDFKQSYNKAVNEVDAFKEILLDKKAIRPAETEDIFSNNAIKHKEMQNILKHIIKNGKKFFVTFFF